MDDDRAPEKRFDDYFGLCPVCHRNDGYANAGRSHRFFCKQHKKSWSVGSNLFSSWKYQTEAEQRAIWDEIGLDDFEDITGHQYHHPDPDEHAANTATPNAAHRKNMENKMDDADGRGDLITLLREIGADKLPHLKIQWICQLRLPSGETIQASWDTELLKNLQYLAAEAPDLATNVLSGQMTSEDAHVELYKRRNLIAATSDHHVWLARFSERLASKNTMQEVAFFVMDNLSTTPTDDGCRKQMESAIDKRRREIDQEGHHRFGEPIPF